MAVVLDAGALIALERRDRQMALRLRGAVRAGDSVIVGAGAVAQVWRGEPWQATLARGLSGMEVVPLDDEQARTVGELMAASKTKDVVDAQCALLVRHGDAVLTSDPVDIARLLRARGVRATIDRV